MNSIAMKFTPSLEEDIFRKALNDEDDGNLADAAKRWDELSVKKKSPDPEMRAWGLIGERYGAEIKKAESLYQQLRAKAAKKAPPADEFEKIALAAVQAELDKDLTLAEREWNALKKKADTPRNWYLLAAKRSHEVVGEISKLKEREKSDK